MFDFSSVWITLAACLIYNGPAGVNSQNSIQLICPAGWTLYNTRCYRIYDYKLTWGGALTVCRTYGAHLVKIRDVYTNNDLSKLATESGVNNFWIGLHLEGSKNVSSQWSDGEIVPQFHGFWMDNQPQFDHGNCVYSAVVNNSPKWSYGTCEWKRNFVCEVEACPQGTFHCRNGMCVSSVYTCDGVEDCHDGSDEMDCPSQCRYYLTSPSGDITSPNYPLTYNSLDQCSWLIETGLQTYIKIQFSTISTELDKDEVLVFGGGPTLSTSSLLARMSGNMTSKEILSPNNFMLVKFSSNTELQLNGFQASWTTVRNNVSSDGMSLRVTILPNTLTSPLFPSLYLPNQETLWILTTPRTREIITIQFVTFDLAEGDTLLIRNGDSADSPVLKELTSTNRPEKYIMSTTNSLYLLFNTSNKYTPDSTGFSLQYIEGCTLVFDESHGYISSPGFNIVNYPNYMTCVWSISTPGRRRVTLIFEPEFDVDTPGDFVQIFEGDDDTGTPLHIQGLDGFSGTTQPPAQSAPGGRLFVRFITNSIINAKGFAARYSHGCSVPNFNDHTRVRETISAYDFGLILTVFCDVGYTFNSEDFYKRQPDGTLVSKAEVKMECLYGGVWSVPRIPQCILGNGPVQPGKTCGAAPTVRNAYVITTSGPLFGDTVRYLCLGGTMQGGSTITCNSDGTWSPPPICVVPSLECPTLTTPGNARRVDVEGTYPEAGTVVRFECDAGYEIAGQPILLCGQTGRWNGNPPMCQELTCYVPAIDHGRVDSSSQFVALYTSLTVTCDAGFVLQGPNSIQCQPSREFTQLPICTDMDECVNGGPCSSGEMCVNTIGSFTCVCQTGYQRQGTLCVDIEECRTNNGNCDTVNGVCVEGQGGYTCRCNTGYTLYTQNGTMGYYIPSSETGLHPSNIFHIDHTCVKNQCPAPPSVSNRIILMPQGSYHYGDRIKFDCYPGHDIQGSAEVTCQASGQWSSALPVCVLNVCPFDDVSGIANPATFSMSTPVSYGQSLNMTCNLTGTVEQRLRTCQYDHTSGEYRLLGDSYNCQLQAQTCKDPKQAPHAVKVNPDNVQNNQGSSFRFMCEPHYIYKSFGVSSANSGNITCGADGKWDYGNLHCTAMTCNYPGVPAGAEIASINGSYIYDTNVMFRCLRPGYQLNKPSALKCVQAEMGGSVSWNDTLPMCIDKEAPSFPSCPVSDVRVRLYDSAGFNVPQATDNSGSVSSVTVTPPYFHPSWPVTRDTTVTYTAVDHAGNSATCVVSIKVIDEEPPTIQCLGSRSIAVDETVTTVTFGDTDVRATDNLGAPTVTFQPPSVSVSLQNLGENITISATAADAQGNTERCFFQLVVVAKTCHPDYLAAPMNVLKTCTRVGGGYRCAFRCTPGYYFYDDYPHNTFVSECQSGGQWSRTYIPSCAAPGRQGRQLMLSVQYTGLTTPPSGTCEQSYLTDIQDKLTSLQASLTSLCSVPTVSGVVTKDSTVTASFNTISDVLTVDIQIPLVPYGLSATEYTTCTNNVITNFLEQSQSISLFIPLFSVVRPGCPSLQGSPGVTDSQSVCEGRGTLSVVSGQQVCKVCHPGTSYNSTGQCQLCSLGTYQNQSGAITCEPCPQETWTDGIGKSLSSECIRECPGYLVSDTGLPPCRQCPANTYKINKTSCASCADGTLYVGTDNPLLSDCTESACRYVQRKNQQMIGGTDIMTAVVGMKACIDSCNLFRRRFEKRQCVGFNFFKGLSMCFLYDIIGSYQGTGMFDFHERICPEVTKAACFCAKKCPAGTFSYNGYEPNCRSCPIGYFSSQPGAGNCQQCPPGETTASLNSTACITAASVLCIPGPCVNGGTCSIIGHSEECDCAPGFTGRYCGTRIDTCASQPCYNGGSCVTVGTTFSCDCNQGFTGDRCETNIDDCRVGQCGEAGVCIDGIGTAQCQCVEGYSGPDCQSFDVRVCDLYPCQNGGTCVPTNNYWRTCDCIPPYTGEDCDRQEVSAACESFSCMNGGTCTDTQGRISCSCHSGYSGNQCQTRNQTCATRDCGVSTVCVDDPVTGLSWCVCQSGYTLSQGKIWTEWFNTDSPTDGNDIELRTAIENTRGSLCFDTPPVQSECRVKGETIPVSSDDCTTEGIRCIGTGSPCPDYEVRFRCSDIVVYKDSSCVLVDYCLDQSPCQNNGVCENVLGGYRCQCPPQFTGANCQLSVNNCSTQPCRNNGTCIEETSGFRCECVTGYNGTTCENNPDDCLLRYCDFAGTQTCQDDLADYTCVCKPGYRDKNCSTNINECASNPCLQSGRCEDGINDYVCICPAGWTGKICDVIVDQCSVNNRCGSNRCQTLFNDVYCGCDGPSCQNLPDICRTANPCVSPATCEINDTTVSCVCPLDRTGVDCGLLTSTECVSTVCENGGTCVRSLSGETKCKCVEGYDGSQCERYTDHCVGVTCPAATTCTNGQHQHFCRCPVGKLPPLCVQDINTDYDLCFYDSETPGSAALPYSIPVTYTNGFSITLWVKFSEVNGKGTFFSLYEDLSGGTLRSTQPVLYISDQGLYSFLDSTQILLPFLDSGQKINDGEWHNVGVTWHTGTSVLRLIMDGVSQQRQEDFTAGLPLPSRLWVSLGTHPLPLLSATSPSITSIFHGCVSQVNIYSRTLDITEMAILNNQSQYVSSTGSVLRWSEYEPAGSALVIRPSTAELNTCPTGFTDPPACATRRRMDSLVRVLFCPKNQFLAAPSGSIRVTWQEPQFEGSTSVTSNYSPGVVMTTGSHAVVYEARDNLGNVATCTFTIYVNSEICAPQANPRGGGGNSCQTSNSSWPVTACKPTCPAPISDLVQSGPVYYTCGPGGDWTSLDQSDGLYPTCGERTGPANVDVKILFQYRVTSMTCEEQQSLLNTRIRQSIANLDLRWNGALCESDTCSEVSVSINCNDPPFTIVEIIVPNVRSLLNSSSLILTPRQIFTRNGLDENGFTFTSEIPGSTPDKNTFDVTVTARCSAGQVPIRGSCYTCGPGTFHSTITNTCVNCPVGQFQTRFGAVRCDECPLGETTQKVGNINQIACSEICGVGEFFNTTIRSCELCPLGTYQNQSGSFSCVRCPPGQVTTGQGSVSGQQCRDGCDSGFQLSSDGQCTACPMGTYREADIDVVCQECPIGLSTPAAGSFTAAQCTVVGCPAGQYRDVSGNTCRLCPSGTYQDTRGQTSCKSCGGVAFFTDLIGATNATQCILRCPAGSQPDQTGSSCELCPQGTFQALANQASCQQCPAGQTTAQAGSTAQTQCIVRCPAGSQPDRTRSSCELCPQGTFQALANQASCQQCPAGQTTAQAGSTAQTQCIVRCPAGSQPDQTRSSCELCPQGTFQALANQASCQQCPAGQTTAQAGSTAQTQCIVRCPAGSQPDQTRSSCELCPQGTFQALANQASCQQCPAGQTTAQAGSTAQTQCIVRCPAGSQPDQTGSSCVLCPQGTFQALANQASCQQCPAGQTTAQAGSTAQTQCIVRCPAGSQPDRTRSSCELCPQGTFQALANQASCQQCPAGQTTAQAGSTAQTQCIVRCPAGSQPDQTGSSCELCLQGTFQALANQASCQQCPAGQTTAQAGSTAQTQCIVRCPAGSQPDQTGSRCELCPQGTFQALANQASCQECPAGQTTAQAGSTTQTQCIGTGTNCPPGQQLAGSGSCENCARGFYKDSTMSVCQSCPSGYITPGQGATSSSDCSIVRCPAGSQPDQTRSSCELCPQGTFQTLANQASCQQCPAGQTTAQAGSTTQTQCIVRCPAGSQPDQTGSRCELCPQGTFQALANQASCQQCPAGQTTAQAGSTTQTQCIGTGTNCPPGQQLAGSGSCENCARGFYKDSTMSVCQSCPSGYITPGQGATSSSDCSIVRCPAGSQPDQTGSRCELCPQGTFQTLANQASCQQCPAGQTTAQAGSTSQTQCIGSNCPPGQQLAGSGSCENCARGFYKDSTMFVCQPCPSGYITPGQGATSSSDCSIVRCSAGFQPDRTGSRCELCPQGTFQALANQASCQQCPAGQTTAQAGSTSQTQCIDTGTNCAPGQQLAGSGSCEDCARGFYKDSTMSVCQQCPSGYVTQGLGATSSTDCSVRDCPAGTRIVSGTICEICPVGTYQSQPYQTDCVQCDPGFSTNTVGATSDQQCQRFCPSGQEVVNGDNCSPCARGTYKDNSEGQFLQCQTCPVEYITPSTGANSRSLCIVRNCRAGYRLNETDNTCVECGIGFFQPQPWQTQCQQCRSGTVTVGTASTSSSDCRVICPAGLEDRNGVCQSCNVGFYKDQQSARSCQQCPDGFRTNTEGATTAAGCTIAACDPGSYLNVAANRCVLCALGEFQPDKWQNSCVLCPDGLVTYTRGAVSQNQCLLECESGREYNQESGQCEECGQGYYRDSADRQDKCQLCPTDRITPGPGATSVTQCTVANCSVPGQFLNVSSNQCVDCPVGTFQDQRWAIGCQICPGNFTTRTTGTPSAKNCYRDCRSGTQVIESNNTCQLCPVSQYRSRGDSWTCVFCDEGFTTAGSGSTSSADCSISLCTVGTAYNQDTNTCQPCALGSYQSQLNQQQCVPCPRNQTTRGLGSVTTADCYSYCSTRTSNCTGLTECVDQPYGFMCQCKRGYVGTPNNCTHVCDLPSYCTNQGVCRKEVFPSCLCPEFYLGETCEIRLAPTSNVNNTIIGTVIGVAVFLLLVALILVGIFSRRRHRDQESVGSLEETNTEGVSMSPSSYMTLRTNTAPYSVLMVKPPDENSDPAFYSANYTSDVDRGYIDYDNAIVRL